MSHPPPWGGSHTGNEANDGLGAVGRDPLSSLLLSRTSNLSNHDDSLGLGVVLEPLQAVDKVGSVERIASNSDASRLAEANGGSLVNSLISERSRAGDNYLDWVSWIGLVGLG